MLCEQIKMNYLKRYYGQILEVTGGQRGHGCPKSKWIDRVEEDTRELGCRN
jgi:hypothetical protein